MKVLVAPASFKGSLGAAAAAAAIAAGFTESVPEAALTVRPLADGGEGTLDALRRGAEPIEVTVADPLGRPVGARLGILEDGSAIVESAEAIGVARLRSEERDPARATSRGVGDLCRAALARGARRILVGLGGSTTVDGGGGMLEALGARLLDGAGAPLPPGGAALSRLARLELAGLDPRLCGAEIIALCDVQSPLLGPRGARLYMPQKGASAEESDALEAGLTRFAELAVRDAGRDVRSLPGAGAGGGLGAGLALLGATLVPGAERILRELGIAQEVARCDLVVGGEGRVDEQTLEGKAMLGLARLAKAEDKPFVLFCGAAAGELGTLHDAGVTAVVPIGRGPASEREAMAGAAESLRAAAREVARLVRAWERKLTRGRARSTTPD